MRRKRGSYVANKFYEQLVHADRNRSKFFDRTLAAIILWKRLIDYPEKYGFSSPNKIFEHFDKTYPIISTKQIIPFGVENQLQARDVGIVLETFIVEMAAPYSSVPLYPDMPEWFSLATEGRLVRNSDDGSRILREDVELLTNVRSLWDEYHSILKTEEAEFNPASSFPTTVDTTFGELITERIWKQWNLGELYLSVANVPWEEGTNLSSTVVSRLAEFTLDVMTLHITGEESTNIKELIAENLTIIPDNLIVFMDALDEAVYDMRLRGCKSRVC